jgi:predicted lipoprotein with Yx(FWY)xxD motif
MLRKTQRGFAATESILIGVIVVLIAFVAWYAFHVKNNTDNTLNKAGNQQIAPPQTSKKPATTTPTTTPSGVVTTKTDSKGVSYLADANGMALYTYSQDSANTSSCSGSCLAVWPAYKATSSSASLPANVGTFTRSDGTVQYTYKKFPLYYYTGDTAAGQVTGDGVNGFSVAKP